jgi:hypothetical protein
MQLTADRSIALYVAWLLSERQRRADRLLAAISGLDGRGRLAMMVLDFYGRLAPPQISYRVDIQHSSNPGPNRELPRADRGAYQPGSAVITRRAGSQP